MVSSTVKKTKVPTEESSEVKKLKSFLTDIREIARLGKDTEGAMEDQFLITYIQAKTLRFISENTGINVEMLKDMFEASSGWRFVFEESDERELDYTQYGHGEYFEED